MARRRRRIHFRRLVDLFAIFLVCPDVFVHVIAPHELLVTDGTGEPLLSRVCPQVAL